MNPMRGKTAVAGIGQTPFYKRGTSPDSERKMVLKAIVEACEDAGIAPSDVDGFATYSWDKHNGTFLVHELGSTNFRWSSMVEGGGGGGIPAAIGVASAAILSGQADIVAVYRTIAEKEFGRFNTSIENEHAEAHYAAHGLVVAAQFVGFRTQRFLWEHGLSRDVMEALVLCDYAHARNNPRAMAYRNELDAQTYRNSRMIVDPYRLFDCSREVDGAAAVIVMSAERARALGRKPVYVLGVEQGNPAGGGDNLDNYREYSGAAFTSIAERFKKGAALSPADIDVRQVYENFSGAGVTALMEHGFFTPENAAEVMTLENLTVPNGKLPTNTSGGCLAEGFIHGMEVVLEGVRQMRGESVNQVAGAETCLVTGGPASTYSSSAIFGTESTL